ncbi:hypothetical protein ACFFQW_24740 [Umezawaea endophytica]|uniref:Effector-associated domain-containing protein n=1 Tax=Umezawaea endophytica TaxID=1654476 RepID=A0A9X2VFM4_9PSEU|nr:hypothetical protein [Umezawaea endophytica]MCS7475780.1 hypothetical protein [Umezawaea endophytica]
MRSAEPPDRPDGAGDAVPPPAVDQRAKPSGGSTAVQAGRDVTFIAEQHVHQSSSTGAPAGRPGGRAAGGRDAFGELVDALMEVDSIREDSARSVVLSLLPVRIAGAVPHHPRARLHVIGLLRTCLDHEDGLLELVAVLRELEGDSLAMRRLTARTSEWTGR